MQELRIKTKETWFFALTLGENALFGKKKPVYDPPSV
jgi:hypothetical protein